jgi:hypothetical protein
MMEARSLFKQPDGSEYTFGSTSSCLIDPYPSQAECVCVSRSETHVGGCNRDHMREVSHEKTSKAEQARTSNTCLSMESVSRKSREATR